MNDGILTCLAPAESCLRTVFLRLVPRFFWNLRILSLLRWRFSFFAFTRQASSSVVDTIFDCGTKAREGAKACQANKRSKNQQCVNNKKVQLKRNFRNECTEVAACPHFMSYPSRGSLKTQKCFFEGYGCGTVTSSATIDSVA